MPRHHRADPSASLRPVDIPSLLIHADPSAFVPVDRIRELEELGFSVRGIPGAGHSVWYGFVDEFMREFDFWLTRLEGD